MDLATVERSAEGRKEGGKERMLHHGMYIDVLENLETYHLSYNAAFRFDKEACFKGICCPTILASNKEDMLFKYFPKLKKYIPNCLEIIHEGWQSKKNAEITTLQLSNLLKTLL